MFWTILLLCILFGAILFIIQRREVRALYAGTLDRAVLFARYMKDMNIPNIGRTDALAIQTSIDNWVSDEFPYIIFYDRDGIPQQFNDWVSTYEEILFESNVERNSRPEFRYVESKRLRIGGEWLRILEVEIPIFPGGEPSLWGSVKIGHSLEPMYEEVRNLSVVLLLVGLGGLLLGVFGATLLAKRITRPLKKLVDGTVQISRGDFSRTIDIASGDEIGDLARSFNEMTDRLLEARERMETANQKLVQAEKLASIGRLAATIAHEIRNPLTSVKLNIQKVAEEENLEDLDVEHLDLSLEGIEQIEKFIKELLDFTRVADLNLERFPLEQVMEESLKTLRDMLVQRKISLEKTYERGLPPVLVDADKMRQVFLNILRNASEAVSSSGVVAVSLGKVTENGGTRIEVRIADNGPGIPEGDWENIFEPFFTTKSTGFGLGLANARKIVEQHNGSIVVTKRTGRGSCFVITIPCEEGT